MELRESQQLSRKPTPPSARWVTAVSPVAVLVPGQRASRVDPMIALRAAQRRPTDGVRLPNVIAARHPPWLRALDLRAFQSDGSEWDRP